MTNYIFNDEDNNPMNDDAWDGPHNPTIYNSRAEMKAAEEPLPFTDPPENGCWNCLNYDYIKEACTLNWNNGDESYYNPDTDDRDPDDCCPQHEKDEDAEWEDWHGTDS